MLRIIGDDLGDLSLSEVNWKVDGCMPASTAVRFIKNSHSFNTNGNAGTLTFKRNRVYEIDANIAPVAARANGAPSPWFGTEDDAPWDFCSNGNHQSSKFSNVQLPICAHRSEIVRLVHENQVVLVQGETGCGKTTQVPQFILEAAEMSRRTSGQRRPVRVVVTQPRRLAAVSVARRVAHERSEEIGKGALGYRIRGDSSAGPHCRLMFCTTGVLLRRLMSEGQKWMFSPLTVTHLIIDEVHERASEVDFLLTYLKSVLPLRSNLRVVLMSATMNTEVFLSYLAKDGNRPPIVTVPGRAFPVYEVYLKTVEDKLDITKQREADAAKLLQRQEKLAFKRNDPMAIRSRPKTARAEDEDRIPYDTIAKLIGQIASTKNVSGAWSFVDMPVPDAPTSVGPGAVLIFLPGVGEISELIETLHKWPGSETWWVLPLHASLSMFEQQECFKTKWPAGKHIKVVCSTNVAETSVTVPDITVVIDSCRVRLNTVDKYSNTPVLREQLCALDALQQRRGRAGRVQPGICFRLIAQPQFYKLEKMTLPEMQRVPLENIYLHVCASGIEDRLGFLRRTPDPPEETAILFAESVLRDLCALDDTASDGLTPLGRHLAALPCHPRLGKILVLGCLLGAPGPCLSVVSALSVRNPMLSTADKELRQEWKRARSKFLDAKGCHRSDHCAWALLFHYWSVCDSSGQHEMCEHYGLSVERMTQAVLVRKHLAEALIDVGLLPKGWYEKERQSLRQRQRISATENRLASCCTEPWTAVPIEIDWVMVRAAVVGGLYPNIVGVERTVPHKATNDPVESVRWLQYTILMRHHSQKDGLAYPKQLKIHPGSLLHDEVCFHCPWLVFFTLQETTKLYAYDVSEASPFALLLFGAAPKFNKRTGHVEVGWAKFSCPSAENMWPVLDQCRQSWQHVLARKLANPSYDHFEAPELAMCAQLLRTNGLGFECKTMLR